MWDTFSPPVSWSVLSTWCGFNWLDPLSTDGCVSGLSVTGAFGKLTAITGLCVLFVCSEMLLAEVLPSLWSLRETVEDINPFLWCWETWLDEGTERPGDCSASSTPRRNWSISGEKDPEEKSSRSPAPCSTRWCPMLNPPEFVWEWPGLGWIPSPGLTLDPFTKVTFAPTRSFSSFWLCVGFEVLISLLSLADFKLPPCLSDCFFFLTPLPGRFEEVVLV